MQNRKAGKVEFGAWRRVNRKQKAPSNPGSLRGAQWQDCSQRQVVSRLPGTRLGGWWPQGCSSSKIWIFREGVVPGPRGRESAEGPSWEAKPRTGIKAGLPGPICLALHWLGLTWGHPWWVCLPESRQGAWRDQGSYLGIGCAKGRVAKWKWTVHIKTSTVNVPNHTQGKYIKNTRRDC